MAQKFSIDIRSGTKGHMKLKKRFICPLCGNTATLFHKSSIKGTVVSGKPNIHVSYLVPKNSNFIINCECNEYFAMRGGDNDEFEFANTMYEAGIFVSRFITGGERRLIDRCTLGQFAQFDPIMMNLSASISGGIDYETLSHTIDMIISKEKYSGLINAQYKNFTSYLTKIFEDEKYDTREISIIASYGGEFNASMTRDECLKIYNKKMEIFKDFYKELTSRIKKEMERIKGE